MKKFLFIFILVLPVLPLMAESEYKSLKTEGWRLDLGAGISSSMHSNFLTVDPEFMYDFGIGAAGIGASAIYGMTFEDLYFAPFARLELLWFYLKGGVIYDLKGPVPNAEKAPDGFIEPDDTPIIPYAVLGADIPVFSIGERGKLGLDLNLGLIPTATPVVLAEGGDNFLEALIGSLITASISAVFDSMKAGVSIYYSHIY